MNLPNKLTLLRVAMVPVFMLVALLPLPSRGWWAAGLFAAAGLTDLVDGWLARRYDLITDFGKFLDPIADKLLVIAALLVLMEYDRCPVWAVMIIVAREFIVTGLRILAANAGRVLAADKLGKWKTTMQMSYILVALIGAELTWGAGLIWQGAEHALLMVALALTVFSGGHYLWGNRALFQKR